MRRIARDEAGADSLNFMWTRLSAREHGALRGFNCDGFERRLLRLDVFAHTGQRAASSNARDQDVDFAIGVFPYLGAGGFAMDLRVRRIVELLQHVTVWSGGDQFFGFRDRAFHALGARREHDFGAEGAQHHPTFHAHGFRHGDDELVAFGRSNECQSDAGVAAGRLDQRCLAGLDFAGASPRLRSC